MPKTKKKEAKPVKDEYIKKVSTWLKKIKKKINNSLLNFDSRQRTTVCLLADESNVE